MPRPHIEFIQSQVLPWEPHPHLGLDAKVLSRDSESGAQSLVLRYPAGWSQSGPAALAAAEEFLVLEGALTVCGVEFGRWSFGYVPAGATRTVAAGPAGAIVLSFFDRTPESAQPAAGGTFTPDRIDIFDDGWDADYGGIDSPELEAAGARKKVLRNDPDAGDQTWLIGTLPLWRERKCETHPVVQEMFLLAGSIAGNAGIMHPGAYFWRPPDILHGPYGSKTGNLILMRSCGGALSTEYYDPDPPFRFDAPHVPVLPPELEPLGRAPWSETGIY